MNTKKDTVTVCSVPFLLSVLLLYPAVLLLMRIPEAWANSIGALYMQQGDAVQAMVQVGWQLVCLIGFNIIFICVTGVCLRDAGLRHCFEELRPGIVFGWILFEALILFIPYIVRSALVAVGTPEWAGSLLSYLLSFLLCVLLFCCSPIEESWLFAMRERMRKNLVLFFLVWVLAAAVSTALASLLPKGQGAGFQFLDALYQWIILAAAFGMAVYLKNSIPVQE